MLEFFRRHRGAFLITVTVIIIISFAVWGGSSNIRRSPEGQPTDPAYTVYGRKYTIADVQRLGRSMQMVYQLQMFEMLGLSSLGKQDDPNNNLVINLLVLKHEMERLGVSPSDEDARAAMEKIPGFQENGQFSEQRAAMVEDMFKANGFTTQDMLNVVKLNIGFSKVRELVGDNYVAGPIEAEKTYASQYQTLKVQTAELKLEDFKKKVEVKDEDIQKYFDENKEGYKTAEKRAISYVLFETPQADEKKSPEEQQKALKPVIDAVNAFNTEVRKPAAKFEEVAKSQKLTVQKVDAFTQDAAPEAIKAEQELLNAIFALKTDVRTIGEPVKGTKGYYVFTVTKTEEPKQQELAEVKEKIKQTLVDQKAQESLSKAASDARNALAEGLKAGKKIEDVAKEQKLTLTPVTNVDVSEPATTLANSNQIAQQARDVAAGEMAKVIDVEGGALIVYVAAKELHKRDNSASLRESMSTSRSDQERSRLFEAWFSRRRDEAEVVSHITQI